MNYFKINADGLFSHCLALLTVSSYEVLLVDHYVLFAVYKDAEQDVKLNNASAANANFLFTGEGGRNPLQKAIQTKKRKILSQA